MLGLGRFYSLLRLLFRRDKVEEELDAEVQSFFDIVVERHVRAGIPEQEARRLARLKFQQPELVKEQIRDQRTGSVLSMLMRDLSYSVRSLRKTPAFSAITILTLALGIGANTTIFSIVNRFVVKLPPVGNPSTLVALHTAQHGECCNAFSWPLFNDVREQARSFSGVAAYYDLVPASISGTGEPERVWGQAATANFFDVAQLGMTLGRGFGKNDEHAAVVVLGHALWQHRFGGDPEIAGKTITLSGRPFTVIGVSPPAFRGLDLILSCQFWVPLGNLDQLLPNTSNLQSRDYHWVTPVGRLKPGVSATETAAELKVLGQRFARAHPESEKDLGFRFETAGSLPPRDKSTVMLFLLAITFVALLVLCIAAANVANLFLTRIAGRQREMAIRLAMGATRLHLLQQLLTESVLLALAGGVTGVALMLWATRALAAFRFPAPVPLDLDVSADWRVMLYTLGLSVAVGVLCGLTPAFTIAIPQMAGALKGEEIFSRQGRAWNLRNILVVVQIGMSLILLCATGLFLRSLQNASSIEIGFRSSGLLSMAVDPRLHGYTPEHTTQFLNRLQKNVSSLPGVRSATYTDTVPLSGGNRSDAFHADGQSDANVASTGVELYMAGPDYLQTVGTPLIAGRDFSDENPKGHRVAIVNQALAERLFKNQNPIGRNVAGRGVTYQIIGIVRNVKSRFLGEDYRPVLYRYLAQDIASDPSFTGYRIVVQYAGDAGALTGAVRREIHSLDPTLAIFDVETMQEHLRDAMFLPRLAGTLFGVFGFMGLTLAAIGLYGVMNAWVSRRTREIGIRLALGANLGEVQWLIIRQGMTLTVVAVIPGLIVAWAVSKYLSSVLYGILPHDVVTFVFMPLFLMLVAFIACWIPSLRAVGKEPLNALHHE